MIDKCEKIILTSKKVTVIEKNGKNQENVLLLLFLKAFSFRTAKRKKFSLFLELVRRLLWNDSAAFRHRISASEAYF